MDEVLIHAPTGMNFGNIMLREKKADTKWYIMYDSIYTKFPVQANP